MKATIYFYRKGFKVRTKTLPWPSQTYSTLQNNSTTFRKISTTVMHSINFKKSIDWRNSFSISKFLKMQCSNNIQHCILYDTKPNQLISIYNLKPSPPEAREFPLFLLHHSCDHRIIWSSSYLVFFFLHFINELVAFPIT